MTILEDTVRLVCTPLRASVAPIIQYCSTRLSRAVQHPRAGFSLPCGGLDARTASAVYFTLRQATDDDAVRFHSSFLMMR